MKRLLLVMLCLAALPLQAAEIKATALYYRMSEPGIDPYLSRWLITDKFLRIDEGEDADNYVLFDRRKRTVYSVVHNDRTVLDIAHRAVDRKPPKALNQESRVIRDENAPTIEGRKTLRRELHINGGLCYSVVSVEQLLPDAVKAIGEYRQVMAGEHAKNIDNTPVELQQPCDLALHIFSPLWVVEKGLPIQEWNPQGKTMGLLDYKAAEPVDGALFSLPQGYRHYQTRSDP